MIPLPANRDDDDGRPVECRDLDLSARFCALCHQWDAWHLPDCPAIPVEEPPQPEAA